MQNLDQVTLEHDDVRALAQLVAEVSVSTASLDDRRDMLARGLLKLTDAQVYIWTINRWSTTEPAFVCKVLDGGWSDDQQRTHVLASLIGPPQPPSDQGYFEAISNDGIPYSGRRGDVLPDDLYYGTEWYRIWREPTRLDDFLVSLHATSTPTITSGFGIHRSADKPRFSLRELAIVHLTLSQLPWIHDPDEQPESAWPIEQLAQANALSHRLRVVLLLIIAGFTRKEIALRLGLSQHTVKEYVAKIQQHYGVRKQAELVSRFSAGNAPVKAGDLKPTAMLQPPAD